MYNPGLVILFGILTTVQMHIAKAMQRQGIEIFDQIREKFKREEKDPEVNPDIKKPMIYIIGFILNKATVVYTIWSQLYGPAALYTSTYGLGLIGLMLYSYFILHEPISKTEWYGSILIMIGTLIIGVEGFYRPIYDLSTVSLSITWNLLIILTILSGIGIWIAYRRNKSLLTGFVFGFVAGAFGGLDAIIKNIAQNMDGTPVLFPVSIMAWIIFILSFIVGGVGFILTQWGFARQARSSILVPVYNSMYIVIPLIFQSFILSTYQFYSTTYLGIIFIIMGIWIMQIKKFKLNNK